MLNKIIKLAVVGLIILAICHFVPAVSEWISKAINWVISNGEVGISVIASAIICSILGE